MKRLGAHISSWWATWFGADQRVDRARATRAMTGFMIPMVLAATVGLPVPVAFMSISAQNIAMLDVRGDYRLRLLLLMAVTLLLASAGAFGVLAAGHVVATVAATMFVAAGGAIWRHLGSDYGLPLSASSMLLFLVSLATTRGPEDLSTHVGGILAGGAIGLVIQMALWPLRAQHPLRRAVGDSWLAAGNLFEAIKTRSRPGVIDATEGELRTALDQATRLLAGASRHRRNGVADRLEALNLLAARLGVRVVAVHTALEGLGEAPVRTRVTPAMQALLTNLINTSRSVAVAVVSQQPAHLATCEVRLRRLEALLASVRARLEVEPEAEGAAMLAGVFERVQAAVPEVLAAVRAVVERAGERALFAVELFDVQTWQLKPLASALNLSRRVDPSLVRFGLRLAVCAGLGTALYRWWGAPHGYWIPFTVMVLMQPDVGSTRRRVWQRLIGTLTGSVVASLILALQVGVWGHLAVIAVGVYGFAFHVKRRYAQAAFFATVFVVLLLEHTGAGGLALTGERIAATIAGGLIALGAAMLFWPVWEHDRFAPVLAKSLQATADYLQRLEARLQSGGTLDEPTVQAKRRAEAASVAVFSSVGRLFADAHNARDEIERAAMLANGNQRVLRLANLVMVGLRDGPGVLTPELARCLAASTTALGALAEQAGPALGGGAPDLAACTQALDTLPALNTTSDPLAMHLARIATEARAMLAGVAPRPAALAD